jgi:hypothetical protein
MGQGKKQLETGPLKGPWSVRKNKSQRLQCITVGVFRNTLHPHHFAERLIDFAIGKDH